MNHTDKILVLGSLGLVGSALIRELKASGYKNILTPPRSELDLMRQLDVEKYFEDNKPEYIFIAAAKVGGIIANDTYRADFIYQNLSIQNNVFGAAFKNPVKKLLFLGSNCIYPKNATQPLKEDYLLTGSLEPTNEPYAIAKIAGLKLAESFRRQYDCPFYSVMPSSLYGPCDNFDLENSHVVPGMIARMEIAKRNNDSEFVVWGSGKPRRELLYVDDLAKACIFLMSYKGEMPYYLNIGTGQDISVGDLAKLISEVIGFEGELVFDISKPDGMPQKLLDVSEINRLGWKSHTSLENGLLLAYQYYKNNY